MAVLPSRLLPNTKLAAGREPPMYGIGIKELWEIPADKSNPGTVLHTIGWPLSKNVYGGSFLYHLENNLVSVGLVVGLDYANPHLSPFAEFQRMKHHPVIAKHLEGGRRISLWCKSVKTKGGIQSLPKLAFPGGCLAGCAAGFMNAARLKGTHTAMKSGILAAESIFGVLEQEKVLADSYEKNLKSSWIWNELHRVRNIRPGFKLGLWKGLLHAAIDNYLLRGKAPWTLSQINDHEQLKIAEQCEPISYPAPDGKLSFDRESSVFLAGIRHSEKQPVHLLLNKESIAVDVNLKPIRRT